MDWVILTATLPTQPSALRVRVWRALKATGAASLREGVYVLPGHAPGVEALCALEHTIAAAGAPAYVLRVAARDDSQAQAFRGLFDRSRQYAEFSQRVSDAVQQIATATATERRRALRGLDAQWRLIETTDFFPGDEQARARDVWMSQRRELARLDSPGEPEAVVASVPRLEIAAYQGRTWATRCRPWVDRLGTAWLVLRFIDPNARVLWLDDPAACAPGVLGFDFDGAAFTHIGDKVTFEVVLESFGLAQRPALGALARLVHCIDVGGRPVEEAAGFEMLVRGLQARHYDDDALLGAALPLFDAALAALEPSDDA